ncbi:zinc-dependent alcohol dehydrogenase family protein [Polyangium aurulentum]|uniref:zinc-dependent alcohol dehydrogenase family protein n=1 Tax=Polyangium aurulentum TaxID=2567896 RepID=UPI00146D98DD|nr:NAD(P)-dependent alcohol dehydrogenase [Polyangium aurulentum]UQA61344.1 NAD(P)-dependent alcohol dehydrogenase [Polyangium aurulentum]
MAAVGRIVRAMKAFTYRSRLSLDDLALVERPDPVPGPHEVVIRVDAVSLNYRDVAIARGVYGGLTVPLVPASDAAGEVIAIGPGASRFEIGARVCPAYVPDWIDGPVNEIVAQRRLGGPSPGVLAEKIVVHEGALVRAPKGWSAIEAATLPIAGVSAWQALVVDAGVRPGDCVAVTGTGGAAVFLVQIALAAGAQPIVIGRDARKLARIAAIGARTVDSTIHAEWDERVRAMTHGRGVDIFVDGIGGDGLERAVRATRVGGTVCLFGFVAGTRPSLDLVATIRRSITLRATSGGSRASFEALVRAIEIREMRPIVDRVFPFEEAPAALAYLAESSPFGKVVIG